MYEVVLARFGARETERAGVFLNNAAMGGTPGPIAMDYFFWVLRDGANAVLVDTGFSVDAGRRRGRTVLADPVDLARRLGAGPESAPLVVVTHAHYDHIGNLAAYDRSAIVVAGAELDFWSDPVAGRGEFAALTEPEEITALRAADSAGRVRRVGDGEEIAPGLRVHVVGGHTPGQLMVEVPTRDGTVLLASDALHYEEELESDVPFTHLADLPDVYRAFDRIRALRDRGAIVLPGHDPATLTRIGAPLEGLSDLTATIGIAAPLERTSS